MNKCPKCDRSFPSAHGLRVHIARKHLEESKSLQRAAKPVEPKPVKTIGNAVAEVVPHYCPRCGLGLRAIALAMVFQAAKGGAS